MLVMPGFLMAQNFVLPKEAKENLKGNDISNTSSDDTHSTSITPYDKEEIILNIWELRIEYVLQYEEDGVITSLAKGDNDYFGFSTSYGIAGDDLIWFDREQLKPWYMDSEYSLYKADTLKPVLSNVLVRKVGKSDYQMVTEAEDGITLLSKDMVAYELPPNNASFRVNNDPSANKAWLLLIGEKTNQSGKKLDMALTSIINSNTTTVNELIGIYKNDGRTFTEGAILYSANDSKSFLLNDFIYIYNDKSQISQVKYKKALVAVKKEEVKDSKKGSKGKASVSECCCENFEKAKNKDEEKAIIKKWKASLKAAKKNLKNEENENKRKAIAKQIDKCETKLDKYGKNFLGF